MSLSAFITFFQKHYCVMRNLMAVWRPITLYSKTLCVIGIFQRPYRIMDPGVDIRAGYQLSPVEMLN